MKEERTYLASGASASDASRPRFVILKRSSCHGHRRKRKKEVRTSTGSRGVCVVVDVIGRRRRNCGGCGGYGGVQVQTLGPETVLSSLKLRTPVIMLVCSSTSNSSTPITNTPPL